MCLIVDNNLVHRVFFRPRDPELGSLHQFIKGDGQLDVRIVYGGQLRREYVRSGRVRKFLLALDRAGRARKVPDRNVDDEEAALVAKGLCASDDPHVIALARVARVALLCSHDRALHVDFTNPGLLRDPRGRIYQGSQHNHLLREHCPRGNAA